MRARRVVAAATAIELVSACLLVMAPAAFAHLLFGAPLSSAGEALGLLAGLSLLALALALACRPRDPSPRLLAQPVLALLVFSVLCALFLAFVGIGGENGGVLLWPAAATHAAMAGLLFWPSLAERRDHAAS
jgi:membrane protease YdiL (CAAX protease family)